MALITQTHFTGISTIFVLVFHPVILILILSRFDYKLTSPHLIKSEPLFLYSLKVTILVLALKSVQGDFERISLPLFFDGKY